MGFVAIRCPAARLIRPPSTAWSASPAAPRLNAPQAGRATIVKQTPRGRVGDPEEIAAAVLWLCSDSASFAVGTILAVDGGYMA